MRVGFETHNAVATQQSIPKIFVIFIDPNTAAGALKSAAQWADGLGFRIDLIVPHVVPYPLPSTSPSVPVGFTLGEIRWTLARAGVNAGVHFILCRDRLQAVTELLPPHSIVIIGARQRRLPTMAGRLARKLQQHGHLAIFA